MLHTIRTSRSTLVITLVIIWSAIAAAQNSDPNPVVYPINSNPYGLSYGEWSAKWWQWLFSIPARVNPNVEQTPLDPDPTTLQDCAQGQTGQVWFLGGRFASGPTTNRTCTVPLGKSLFFPIVNTTFGAGVGDCQTPPPGDPVSCDSYTFGSLTGVPALRAAAAAVLDNPGLLEVSIDGIPLKDLTAYRAKSPVFSYSLPSDNVYNSVFGFNNPAGTYYPVVSDGYWIMIMPLSLGEHTIDFKTADGFQDIHYDITVGTTDDQLLFQWFFS